MPEETGEIILGQEDIYASEEKLFNAYLEDLGLSVEDLKGKKILDLGAGQASFARVAMKKGAAEVISIDRAPEKWFKDGGPPDDLKYHRIDILDLPWPFQDGEFNLVVSRATFQGLDFYSEEELENVLGEAERVLKDNGEFRFGPGTIHLKTTPQDYQRHGELETKAPSQALLRREKDELKMLKTKLDVQFKLNLRLIFEEVLIDEHCENKLPGGEEVVRKARERLARHPDITVESLSRELKQKSLMLLQSVNPNISLHEGNRKMAPFEDCYFIMKNRGAVEKQHRPK